MSDTVSFKTGCYKVVVTKVDDGLYKIRFRKSWFSCKDKMIDVNSMKDAVMKAQWYSQKCGFYDEM